MLRRDFHETEVVRFARSKYYGMVPIVRRAFDGLQCAIYGPYLGSVGLGDRLTLAFWSKETE